MKKYYAFLSLFIVTTISFVVFLVFYLKAFFLFFLNTKDGFDPNPSHLFEAIFTPTIIISLVVAGITSLACRIMGVVMVAKNKVISDNEKIFWILGFVFMPFIAGIVFLILAKSKKFID